MKTIFTASIRDGKMGESYENEYGREWDGDVAAYIANIVEDADLREGIPGDVHQDFAGLTGIENVYTMYIDGEPTEVWFAANARPSAY